MKGIILAGGNGTRLYPLTKAVNKHLLPVHGRSMLHHCVDKMTEASIHDILVITGGEHLGGIAEFLGSGKEFNCNLTYRVQEKAGGIAEALDLAKGFINPHELMCVLLGDNIFEDSLKPYVKNYIAHVQEKKDPSAMVLLKEIEDPSRFGVAALCDNKIVQIVEKPQEFISHHAVTGIYFYPYQVFDIISTLKPSARGELEITDVNNYYVKQGTLYHDFLNGWWTDAGTHESFAKANDLMRMGTPSCAG